ncbi:UBP-type zinc finger domain-containing protein [Georgenia yuyongxinii]|uniref:UBP-type zinc finger domain-containing protein n=1 Tax=Georgenia yuyongxinii TaxID=2589797 RepID=A0A552WPE4_9MICO|nr:UBP-type zinc finger domain-containing protein [Georgenia yuyongxinii]TRW44587.1 UBP-type zinc finger domain-containing protein [Georgenia yuyongxinii]
MAICTHLETIDDTVTADGAPGCEDCLAIGARWVHLRACQFCGHIGCCDSSPNKHARGHSHGTGHPIVRSYEPGEEWYFCFPDELTFEIDDAPPAPSHA